MASHPYTCNTCQVAFRGSELQRGHMQSDWHRYNLKRRVASLPPLTSEVFAEKVLANQASAAATAARAQFEKICAACQRTYYSQNAYENHLRSQKHKARIVQLSEDMVPPSEAETTSIMSSTFSLGEPVTSLVAEERDPEADAEFAEVIDGIRKTSMEDKDPVSRRPTRPHHSAEGDRPEHPISAEGADPEKKSAEAEEIVVRSCLFCNLQLQSIDDNLSHMERTHGLFVPERQYLVDLEGLISHLHERVDVLHECLFCGQIKQTTAGIQTHMRDKGHCMIAFESEEEMIEVGQYYDFRSTYSDDELEENEEGNEDQGVSTKLGVKRGSTYVAENGDDMTMLDDDEENDWEDDDGEESDDTSTVDGKDTSKHRKRNDMTSSRQAYYDGYELHLPTGRVAGHRALARYFRQNLVSRPSGGERVQQLAIANGSSDAMEEDRSETASEPSQQTRQLVSRANGGLGMLAAPEHKKAEVKATEMREQKRAQRAETRYQWGNEKRANMQKHYRDPLLQ